MFFCVPFRGLLLRVWEAMDSTSHDESSYKDDYQLLLSCLLEMTRDGSPGRTAASVNMP